MPEQVDPWLKDEVRKGHYKKVSMGFYPDLGIRHLGFLGAMPPAVKGLKEVRFSEKAAWEIETDFQYMDYWQQETVKSIFQRMRDWMIDKFGLEEADKVIGSYDLDALKPEPKETSAVAAGFSLRDPLAITQSFSSDDSNKPADAKAMADKGGKKMDVAKMIADFKALILGAEKELTPPDPGGAKFTEAEVQAREAKATKDAETIAFAEVEKQKKEKEEAQKKLKEIETNARKAEIHSFCESLAKGEKLIPAWTKMGIEEFIFNLDSNQPIQFSEGQDKKSRSQWFMDFLKELPKLITFSEVAGGKGPGSGGSAAEKLSVLVKQKMDKKKDLSYGAAFAEVQKENLEVAKEYQTEINPNK